MSLSIGAEADSAVQLSRTAGDARPAAPVRIVHLGLGNFFRAHQASYPDMAPDVEQWGIAAFTGRSAQPAGHRTIAEAVNDPICREWLVQWWTEASGHLRLTQPEGAHLPSINYQSIEEGHAHVDDVGLRR